MEIGVELGKWIDLIFWDLIWVSYFDIIKRDISYKLVSGIRSISIFVLKLDWLVLELKIGWNSLLSLEIIILMGLIDFIYSNYYMYGFTKFFIMELEIILIKSNW